MSDLAGVGPALSALKLAEILKDATEIRSACGYMWMRMAVAADAQDAFDVGKREFEEHREAFQRLETSLPAALAALSGSVGGLNAAPPWQPIETARKDGWIVLLAEFRNGCSSHYVGHFAYRTGPRKHWVTIPGAWERNPTHWMPLPASPVCAAEKKAENTKTI